MRIQVTYQFPADVECLAHPMKNRNNADFTISPPSLYPLRTTRSKIIDSIHVSILCQIP